MSIVISIIGALLVLTLLVVVHEGGHYFMGKWLGFRITEFAIGMGPKLFSKEKNGTVYSIRAFPIGGLCAFYGEDEDLDDKKKEDSKGDTETEINAKDDTETENGAEGDAEIEISAEEPSELRDTTGAWNTMPAWKRFLVALAGPFMNVVLAFVLAALLMLIFGEYKSISFDYPMVTAYTERGTPAEASGIEVGDVITAINGKAVASTDEMISLVRADDDGDIDVTVMRPTESSELYINGVLYEGDGQDFTEFCRQNPAIGYTADITNCDTLDITVKGTYNEENGRNMLGVTITTALGSYEERYNVITAIPAGGRFVGEVMDQMFRFLGSLFTGGVNIQDVSGIVGVVDVVNDGVNTVMEQEEVSAGEKASTLIQFMWYLAVLLSINLGIINLLPLPALDGGRIVFNVIEMAVGRAIPAKVEGIIHTVGLILLLGLIAVITVKDVIFVFIK